MENEIINKLKQSQIDDYKKTSYLSLFFNSIPTKDEGEHQLNISLEYAKSEKEENVLKIPLPLGLIKIINTETLEQKKSKNLVIDIIEDKSNLRNLSIKKNKLITVFIFLQGEAISFSTIKELLPSIKNLKVILEILVQENRLIQSDDSYKINPHNRYEINYQNPDNYEELINNLIEKLSLKEVEDKSKNSRDKDVFSFVNYAENIVRTFKAKNINLAVLCERLGIFFQKINDLNKASHYFREYSRVTKDLVTLNPEDLGLKNNLATSYLKLGETCRDLGNTEQALTYFGEYSNIAKELHVNFPQNLSFKNSLAISYSKLGKSHNNLGNLEKTLEYFEMNLELRKELFENFPSDVNFKQELAISYYNLGDTYSTLGDLKKALQYFEKNVHLAEELNESYPKNTRFKSDYAISLYNLGELHYKERDFRTAINYFTQAYELTLALKESYSGINDNYTYSLADLNNKLGRVYFEIGKLDNSINYYREGEKLTGELLQKHPNQLIYKKLKNEIEDNIRILQGFSKKQRKINLRRKKASFQEHERNLLDEKSIIKIRNLIAKGHLSKALILLQELSDSWEVTLFRDRLNILNRNKKMAIISHSEANLELNKITASVLILLTELSEQSGTETTDIRYEMDEGRNENPLQFNNIFISYNHKDTPFADVLEKYFDAKGIRFWRDVHNDAPAGRLDKIILQEMKDRVVLLLLSKNSVNSNWVEFEIENARRLEKEVGRDMLCPIALDDTWQSSNWSPLLMNQIKKYNVLDFSNWEDMAIMEQQLEKLLEGLALFYKK